MAKIESCDKVVGSGSVIVTAGAYKDADEKTRYKYGLGCADLGKAELGEELWDKFAALGIHRARSVDAAGTFNKANEFGTDEDATAFVERWSSAEGFAKAFEKARREGGAAAAVTTPEKKAIKDLEYVLRTKTADGSITNAKVPVPRADNPPKTAKGAINFNAWAKNVAEIGHPWYDKLLKQAQSAADKLD